MHDLWRRSNGPNAQEWTWLSHRHNGFRFDHAFANAAFVDWADTRCQYDHTPPPARGTDHSALAITYLASMPAKAEPPEGDF